MEIAITKMSSKGQVVIPIEMRKGMKEGEKLILIKNKDQFILKKASKIQSEFAEDLEFAERTEKVMDQLEKGKGLRMDFDKFLDELKKW